MPPSEKGACNGKAKQVKSRLAGQLIRPHSLDFYLALDLCSVCQPHMQQDHPIASHGEREIAAVAAWRNFGGSTKHRGHPRVRHIGFEDDAGSAYRLGG